MLLMPTKENLDHATEKTLNCHKGQSHHVLFIGSPVSKQQLMKSSTSQ